MDNISSIRQNNLVREEEVGNIQSQAIPKGKSLGNKKVTNIMKEKYGPITEKKVKNLKSRGEHRKKKNFIADPDEYYE